MPSDTSASDPAPAPSDISFTFSHPGQPPFRRALIRTVEALSGQPRLRRLYTHWASHDQRPGEPVFDAALRRLDIRPSILSGEGNLARIPGAGGLLIVANHPFGVADGLVLGHLGMRLRGNVRVLTNSLLCRVPELEPHMLPVDFSGTPQARRLTAETRRQAAALLALGKVIAIFPAGGVATANRPLSGRAADPLWHPFAGRLAMVPGTTVLPVHIRGQNSRLFQIASHISFPLRVALLFHETRRRMGLPVDLSVGAPIAAQDLAALPRDGLAAELRRRTMALAPARLADPDEHFVWPARIRW